MTPARGRRTAPARWLAFDLDGTLIDARLRQVEVTAGLLAQHGAPALERGRFWRLKRSGASTASALRTLGYPADLIDTVSAAWPEHMESDGWLEQDRALPGAARVLRALRAEGGAIAVITARRRPAGAALSLAAAGLAQLVDEVCVVAPSKVTAGKARHLRALGAQWLIGDTDSDGSAARSAGVPFVAVSTGQRAPGYLRARGYPPAPTLRAAVARVGSTSAA